MLSGTMLGSALMFGLLFAIVELGSADGEPAVIIPTLTEKPTIVYSSKSNMNEDIHNFTTALTLNLNFDEALNILMKYNADQREAMIFTINNLYGYEYLLQCLYPLSTKDLRGLMSKVLAGLPVFYATELFEALMNKDEDSILEIFLSMNNYLTQETLIDYTSHYDAYFIGDLHDSKPSIGFEAMTQIFTNFYRIENPTVNATTARIIASQLNETLSYRGKLNINAVSVILIATSYPEILYVDREFKTLTGKTIIEALEARDRNPLKKKHIAAVHFALDKPKYYAMRLKTALDDFAKQNSTVSRIIIGRAPFELGNIKEAYKTLTSHELIDDVKRVTTGNWQKILSAFIQPPVTNEPEPDDDYASNTE